MNRTKHETTQSVSQVKRASKWTEPQISDGLWDEMLSVVEASINMGLQPTPIVSQNQINILINKYFCYWCF